VIVLKREAMVTWVRAGKKIADFPSLVASYPASEFASPRRSTVPLLAYWRTGATRLAEFFKAIGAPTSSTAELHFEFKVPVQSGSGKPSCTDLMILSDVSVIAIEAKFSESRYDDVATWLGPSPTRNRLDVLRGWLGLLQGSAGKEISIDDIRGLPYQLIHRAASVCYPKRNTRWLVYQVFEAPEDVLASYRADLRALADLLGPRRTMCFALLECELEKSAVYAQLAGEWERGSKDLSRAVVGGLIAGDLIEPRIRSVTVI